MQQNEQPVNDVSFKMIDPDLQEGFGEWTNIIGTYCRLVPDDHPCHRWVNVTDNVTQKNKRIEVDNLLWGNDFNKGNFLDEFERITEGTVKGEIEVEVDDDGKVISTRRKVIHSLEFTSIKGWVVEKIAVDGEGKPFSAADLKAGGINELHFHFTNKMIMRLFHSQDCCEHVYLNDVVGDLDDLIGHPITMAEVPESKEGDKDEDEDGYVNESSTWTFYKLATIKGYVDMRFLGSSNGYYSEDVDVEFILPYKLPSDE